MYRRRLVRRRLWCRPLFGRESFHSIPFRVVFRRGEPGHVAREVVVVSVGSIQL